MELLFLNLKLIYCLETCPCITKLVALRYTVTNSHYIKTNKKLKKLQIYFMYLQIKVIYCSAWIKQARKYRPKASNIFKFSIRRKTVEH